MKAPLDKSPDTSPSSDFGKSGGKKRKGQMLPEEFSPSEYHVIIGRGRKTTMHEGNCRMRALVQSNLLAYKNAEKTNKSFLLQRLGRHMERQCPGQICFVKHDSETGRWYAPPSVVTRATLAQAFRDALPPSYRSSKHSKQFRRLIMKGYVKDGPSPDATSASPVSFSVDYSQPRIQSESITLQSAFRSDTRRDRNENGAGIHHAANLAKLHSDHHSASPFLPSLGRSANEIVDEACSILDKSQGQVHPPYHLQSQAFDSSPCFTATVTETPTAFCFVSPPEPSTGASIENLLTAPMPPDNDEDELLLRQHLQQQQQQQDCSFGYASLPAQFEGPNRSTNIAPCPSYDYESFVSSEQTSTFSLQDMAGETYFGC